MSLFFLATYNLKISDFFVVIAIAIKAIAIIYFKAFSKKDALSFASFVLDKRPCISTFKNLV